MLTMTEIDQLSEKFGGRFKLTVLIQKRLKEIVRGSAKLVDLEDRNLINIVLEEIKQGKVSFEGDTRDDADEEKGRRKSKKKE